MVLVPDNLCQRERRQQSFGGREDYHWRYNLGIQLHLVGQSTMGWMVADLGRCLDVLLGRSNQAGGFAEGVYAAVGASPALQFCRTQTRRPEERTQALEAFLRAPAGVSGPASNDRASIN